MINHGVFLLSSGVSRFRQNFVFLVFLLDTCTSNNTSEVMTKVARSSTLRCLSQLDVSICIVRELGKYWTYVFWKVLVCFVDLHWGMCHYPMTQVLFSQDLIHHVPLLSIGISAFSITCLSPLPSPSQFVPHDNSLI